MADTGHRLDMADSATPEILILGKAQFLRRNASLYSVFLRSKGCRSYKAAVG